MSFESMIWFIVGFITGPWLQFGAFLFLCWGIKKNFFIDR